MHIGDLIRLKRKSHRLTQIELSEKILSCHKNKICKLEKNPKYIVTFDLKELHILSKVLEIDINILIEEKKIFEQLKKK
ncbi:helix-turn-helix domain-containing protein [Paraclostridium bifermentans]|uniref:helix-turn-helix domain-containing protein n=1 Tax=Paraclostridium bifermentans TaxID=1490 RepID=UPI001A9B1EA6|nr:hypothetical protein [Paraclostridium bifermentans]